MFPCLLLFQCVILRAGTDEVLISFRNAVCTPYTSDSEVAGKFIEYSGNGENSIDVMLMQLYFAVDLPQDEIDRLLGLLTDGIWKDIDYSDRSRGGWKPTLHVTRILALARAYCSPSSPAYGNAAVGKVVHEAMKWWFDNLPGCPNWWHNEIGVPKKMAAALLLMKDELTQEEINGGMEVLRKSSFGKTGQNKVWLAGNQLMKGLLTDDSPLVREAVRQITEEIRVTEAEGIKPDWSFHQHGMQVQFGNYGLAFAEGVSFWMRVLDGTEYSFSQEDYDIIGHYVLDGLCRTVWKGFFDPSFCGRQLHIGGGRGKAFSIAVVAGNLLASSWCGHGVGTPTEDMLRRRELVSNLMESIYYPDNSVNGLTGAVYFPYSDCGIYRTRDWYASIRMSSERTIGFEFTNNENRLANFSADGALLVMTDGKEYEDVFACWDWRMVPGVTAYDDGQPIRCRKEEFHRRNHSGNVGGRVEGNLMASWMELDRDSLHAFKSAFFFPECIVALGAGIKSFDPSFRELTTSVDQTNLSGEIMAGKGWVWHNGKAYISLDGREMNFSDGFQEGSWENMAPFYKGVSDRRRIFKCWFRHKSGDTPEEYAYMVVPGVSADDVVRLASHPIVKVLRNDASCQAVSCGENVCVVVHTPGKYRIGRTVIESAGQEAFFFRKHSGVK
ncbi:MAG: polysaccharide lyase family 8 super-sandwich domain-containing protein [Candidatus Cryptobacteroides sp.]